MTMEKEKVNLTFTESESFKDVDVQLKQEIDLKH